MDISVIVLNYNNREVALNCLRSIKEADFSRLNREVFVIDNNSNDGLVEIGREKFSDFQYIKNKENVGMGAGNNVGVRMASGKYIVIMNPDTMASKDVFRKMFDFMENNPDIAIAGPKQFYPDGTPQDTCYRWHKIMTPFYRRTPLGNTNFGKKDLARFLMKDTDKNKVMDVDWLLGSFLFCRAEVLKKIDGFDEGYFLYFEDTDIARRTHQSGSRVVYFPEASIIHNHSRLSAQKPWYKFFMARVGREHIYSWLRYLLKWGIN